MSDPLARLRAFPRAGAPNDDVSAIRGNCSMANKQLAVNVLMRVGAGESTVWGHEMIKRTKLVEMNVRPRPYTSVPSGPAGAQSLEAEVKFEVAVQQGMLNYRGAVSGSCIGHLIDLHLRLLVCSRDRDGNGPGVDPEGVSLAVEIKYSAPALPGTTLGIVCTTMSNKGKIRSSRAEIYNKETGQLVATGSQSIMPIGLGGGTSSKRSKM